MGRIIAISGGDLESTKYINKYAIGMLHGVRGKVLFVGTASKDAEGYIENITEAFSDMGCEVRALELVSKEYTDEEITDLLSWANIIYIGGGDTIFMMNIWKKHGLDVLLRDVYEKDAAILMGISAGAMCWFNCGCTDSELAIKKEELSYGWANDLLDIYNYAYCPHYEDRVKEFDVLMKEKNMVGLAMESNTAFVEENGSIHFIKGNELAKAYCLKNENGKVEKREIRVEGK